MKVENNKVREILTSDIDELSLFQLNKNRRYTQLHSGDLTGHYVEINLGDVQIFREHLNAGTLIEAAPAKTFVPFSAVLSNADNFNFCGKKREKNTLLQATGGSWDACFKGNLHFVVAAFNRETFSHSIQQLTGSDIPTTWLTSKACLTDAKALDNYASGLDKIITGIKSQPDILKYPAAQRMLCDYILRLVLNTLIPTTPCIERHRKLPNRICGVRLVIDYLHSYADHVPTIAELCKIANLNERNLQYGFKEYLGITPTRYLRLVRLNGVRRDLLLANPKTDKIVHIALNWGFIELGRFAGEYRQLFQELPSVTMSRFKGINHTDSLLT